MADNSVKDARSFLFAVSESMDHQFDADALEWLENMEERIFTSLDARGVKGRERDRIIAYDYFLKGVQLKLRKAVVQAEPDMKIKKAQEN